MSGASSISSQSLSSANSSEIQRVATIVFLSITLYNSLELAILIPLSFKHYRGLYFWALLISNIMGVIPSSIAVSLQYLEAAPVWLTVTMALFGFYFMVPGQSVVLYSRLHLVSSNLPLLHFLKYMILINSIALLIPITVLYFGWAFWPTPPWSDGYNTIERIQVTYFSAQEILLSTIYIVETIKLLLLSTAPDSRRKKVLYELIAVNLIAISMDISITTLEYLGYYFTHIILKPLVYSIKLKLEFAVLGLLVSIVAPSDGLHLICRVGPDCTTTLNVT